MTIELEAALNEVEALIRDIDTLVRVVLSGKRQGMTPVAERLEMRPVLLKGQLFLQVVQNDGRQATTKNYDVATIDLMTMLNSGFSSFHVERLEETYSIRVTKKETVLINRKREQRDRVVEHDHQKIRYLDPRDAYLREVGISDHEGRVKPSRQDKYRQVEEFLRLLIPTLTSAIAAGHIVKPTVEDPLNLVDLGCGSAYLTFATHQYLTSQSIPVRVTGIDIRVDSRDKNTAIAEKLGISDSISFIAEEISTARLDAADVVIALHACDTATDDAIAWAVKRDVKLLMVAPCCHHDLQTQMVKVPSPWKLVTRNGLLKERFADLLTDSLRAHILKLVGYRSEVIEFVGDAHTPRNLMIRAVKTGSLASAEDLNDYRNLVSLWQVNPALADRLAPEMEVALHD